MDATSPSARQITEIGLERLMKHYLRLLSATVIPIILIATLLSPMAFAQETTAGLQGTVKDPTGALVTKARVEVTSPALVGVKKLETDAGGYFRFANLPPGVYTL